MKIKHKEDWIDENLTIMQTKVFQQDLEKSDGTVQSSS